MAKKTATQPKPKTSKPRAPKAKPTETAPTQNYAWLRRINARRTLDHAIKLLGKYDFAAFGVDVAPAVDVLRTASKTMAGA